MIKKDTFNKIKKIVNHVDVDESLLKMYNPQEKATLTEFKNDFKSIIELRKTLQKFINKRNVNILSLRNKIIFLDNIFGIEGLLFIAIEYFSINEFLFEYFCTLVYFQTGIKISNRMNKDFLIKLKDFEEKL